MSVIGQGALAGIRVLDFTTLLPGPLATLMLARAGADVVKIERPPGGDPIRARPADFAMLNAGKRSLFLDLKAAPDRAAALALADAADVLVEQFRPGVMDRLGLGAEALCARNPRLVYCSINSYGSTGPDALKPGHDLTFAARSGLLTLSAAPDGAPIMPPAMIADIGGGTYPALVNVLLALHERHRTGRGAVIEIAMADGLAPFLQPAYASAYGRGHWPGPNDSVETGSSPRYALYETADRRWIAAAPVEDHFWLAFCEAIGLPDLAATDAADPAAAKARVAARLRERPAAEWMEIFGTVDTACELVRTFREAQEGKAEGLDLPLPVVPGLATSAPGPACPTLLSAAASGWLPSARS